MKRSSRLSPLGLQRLRLLDCLGGNSQRARGYFDPPPDSGIFSAFATHVRNLSVQRAGKVEPLTVSLLAAGRLMTGDITAARTIVDHLPVAAFEPDHGAGYCVTAPLDTLNAALPLPEDLRDTRRWTAGSPEQERLHAWLDRHERQLCWLEEGGVYVLPPAADRG